MGHQSGGGHIVTGHFVTGHIVTTKSSHGHIVTGQIVTRTYCHRTNRHTDILSLDKLSQDKSSHGHIVTGQIVTREFCRRTYCHMDILSGHTVTVHFVTRTMRHTDILSHRKNVTQIKHQTKSVPSRLPTSHFLSVPVKIWTKICQDLKITFPPNISLPDVP